MIKLDSLMIWSNIWLTFEPERLPKFTSDMINFRVEMIKISVSLSINYHTSGNEESYHCENSQPVENAPKSDTINERSQTSKTPRLTSKQSQLARRRYSDRKLPVRLRGERWSGGGGVKWKVMKQKTQINSVGWQHTRVDNKQSPGQSLVKIYVMIQTKPRICWLSLWKTNRGWEQQNKHSSAVSLDLREALSTQGINFKNPNKPLLRFLFSKIQADCPLTIHRVKKT